MNLNFKNPLAKFRKHYNWLLVLALLVLLALEFSVVKTSTSSIIFGIDSGVNTGPDPRVRVNFTAYDQAVNRISNAPTFTPSGGLNNNPFGSR